jgi:hypothetical protein
MERLRANPREWALWQAEVAKLDGTLGDGLTDLVDNTLVRPD